jgi:hypothetical protein
MIEFTGVAIILAHHFVGDFVLQTDDMAKRKSKSNAWLGRHVAVYTATLMLAALMLFRRDFMTMGLAWIGANSVLHLAIDWCTSRMTTRLWSQGKTHDFFVVIGFDQMLHFLCLFGTLAFIKG